MNPAGVRRFLPSAALPGSAQPGEGRIMSDSTVADYEKPALLLAAALYGLLNAAQRGDKEAFSQAYEWLKECRGGLSAAGTARKLLLEVLSRRGPREPVEWSGIRGVCYGDLADDMAAAIEMEIRNTPPSIYETGPRGCAAALPGVRATRLVRLRGGTRCTRSGNMPPDRISQAHRRRRLVAPSPPECDGVAGVDPHDTPGGSAARKRRGW